MMHCVQVSIPNTLHDYFDYAVTDRIPAIGSRVWVPFGRKTRLGIVIGHQDASIPLDKIKLIESIVDDSPLLSSSFLKLCQFVSQYYQAPFSQVLTLALPKRIREGKNAPRSKKSNALERPEQEPLVLNEEQNNALNSIRASLGQYHAFLLDGVTGSGKTEVYLEAIKATLERGEQALILVPEIGLTPQLITRFQKRLPCDVALIHSQISEGKRHQTWLDAQQGQAMVIIGTRTAIFTPFKKLGLIIIDEEHDSSYKQMEGVRYSARDTALMRAHLAKIPIVLGSATPSLETLANCKRDKYSSLFLSKRALNNKPVHLRLIDLRSQTLVNGFASTTLNTIREHLEAKKQVLVFINRRGFAPVLLCHQCGFMADCPRCDAHLTLHQKTQRLHCHHCHLSQALPKSCPKCTSHELIPIGAGTQRVENHLLTQFKDYHILRIDRDEVQQKEAFKEKLNQIETEQVQLIVGTQMLAKGHHFNKLTLVVILDCDQGLLGQDFRALEKFGQLLTQVSGRAGRASFAGEVLIQTHYPKHPLLLLLLKEGYQRFAQALLLQREAAHLPPYQHLALLRAEANQAHRVRDFLAHVKSVLTRDNIEVMGPAPAPMAKKAGLHREQLLIKSANRQCLQASLSHMRQHIKQAKLDKNIRFSIDVDPIDLN